MPERYADASPNRHLPLGVPQVLIWGEHENFVPQPLAQRHVDAATKAGDRARLVLIPAVGHFELASPHDRRAWPAVLAAIRSMMSTSADNLAHARIQRPIVESTAAPAGTERFGVQWLRIAVPNDGAMLAAVARPPGAGPFPAVLLLHGTHGFAREYVEWARDLARGGVLAVAACWFSGGSGAGAEFVSTPIPCPDLPPLGPGAFEPGVDHIDALVRAVRTLPDVRHDRVALASHSRGGGGALQFLMGGGVAQALILHSSGYATQPETRASTFAVPILILHGTADSPADGGHPVNNNVARARLFEAALRDHQKVVEAHYYEGGGHSTFFTNSTQREDELRRMLAFLHRHLGR